MITIPEQFQKVAGWSDQPQWPFDVPWIMRELRKRGFSVVNAGSLKSAEVYDATGQTWMHRALKAENLLRDAIYAHETDMKQGELRFTWAQLCVYLDKVRAAWRAQNGLTHGQPD